MSKITHYIIRTDEPFRGIASVLLDNGKVAYTDKTFAEYEAESPNPLALVTEAEIDQLIEKYHASLITKPEPITQERFWDLLECLPPCRWCTVGGVELFHVSERLTGNLVTWCARIGTNHYSFTDQANADMKRLAYEVIKTDA